MANYDLILVATNAEGEPTGSEVELAKVRGSRVTGRLSDDVKELRLIGATTLGITGPEIPFTLDDPDVVAFALGQMNGALVREKIRQRGPVVARTTDGEDIPFRYAGETASGGDVITDESDAATVPLD